ncbi:glycosyltransferase family 2 protein [Candidatus Falkowbacteria bacterium]|nr:glycosyltransferase family 2 protein [Candidatus Falkowbacteria bacterium]
MNIYIVVPAYNEARHISQTVGDLKKQFPPKNIVVVDDGSVDDTFTLAQTLGVVALRHRINRGQGAALQTGNEYALSHGAEAIVHFDADGQHQASEVGQWIAPIIAGTADVVLGSRFLGTQSNIPLSKKVFFKIIIPLHNLFIGLRLTDLHNGTRVLSRAAAEKIRITQDGMAHNSEISGQISKFQLRYTEVPVTVTYSEYGQGLRGAVKIFKDLMKRGVVG